MSELQYLLQTSGYDRVLPSAEVTTPLRLSHLAVMSERVQTRVLTQLRVRLSHREDLCFRLQRVNVHLHCAFTDQFIHLWYSRMLL